MLDQISALELLIRDTKDRIKDIEGLTVVDEESHAELVRLRPFLYRLHVEREYLVARKRRQDWCAANPDDSACRLEDV